jgi:ketosteroid isomerase-like protein
MSQENVEVALKLEDAISRRDADAVVACLAPEVEWEENDEGFPGLRRIYRGRAGVREWFAEAVVEPWEDSRLEGREISEAPDDRVFWGGAFTARGKGSGVETELTFWTVLWLKDSQIARRQVFLNDRAAALKAAGLAE